MQRNATAASIDLQADPPDDEDVRAELERVLSSQYLEATDRRRSFLRYVVEETLAGRSDQLKGYTVATKVFGRAESFDPQSDPVVRLEARRLRRDLDCYYVDSGRHDPVRITIPKGSYVPRFEWNEAWRDSSRPGEGPPPQVEAKDDQPEIPDPASAGGGRRWGLVLGGVAVAVFAAIAAWIIAGERGPSPEAVGSGGPSIVVAPFEALSANDESRFLANGMATELTNGLMRFPGFRLYALRSASDDGWAQEPLGLARERGIAYVVTGKVAAEATTAYVALQLVEAGTGAVVWSGTYDQPLEPETLIQAWRELSEKIAVELGQPYGIVNTDVGARHNSSNVAHMQSYACVLRAYHYRRSFSRDEVAPIRSCLEEAVRRDPAYGDAWAMLAWLHLDTGRFEFSGNPDPTDEYEKALEIATRAISLEPDNTLALKAASSIYHYMGRYDESEDLARRAVELNPFDPDALAQLGWRLAVRGKFEEGIPILRRAIDRTVNPPGWYFHLVAIDLCLRGDYPAMLDIAKRSAVDGSGVSQALVAIASARLGDRETAGTALETMGKHAQLKRDAGAYFRRNGATQEIADALVAELDAARDFVSEDEDN